MKSDYEWKRFLCPREGRIDLSDRGFLVDPESQYGAHINPDVVNISAVAETPCLVFLGEPGIGKSYTVDTEYQQLRDAENVDGRQFLRFDLGGYQTDIFLQKDVFENPNLLDWKAGEHDLFLFLDSFDECILNIRTAAALLARELKDLPSKRLYLRLACRTASWPSTLESELQSLWSEDEVGVYEITPLRRKDVAVAAEGEGVNPQEFLEAVEDAGVVPFAITPVTLSFLLNTIKRRGKLLTSKTDLYYEGCRLLCDETNPVRLESGAVGTLSTEKRLIAAGRIAALTVLGNKSAVHQGAEHERTHDADISIGDICGGEEVVSSQPFEITRPTVQEALGTGLFSSRGLNRMGWSHQTYAEFLTAWYLYERNVPLKQLKQLITHPGDPDGKLPPQLHETAAWLARYIPDIFTWLTQSEPDILLHADVAAYSNDDRRALIGSLLADPAVATSISRDFSTQKAFRNLDHPQLSEQLRIYIGDPAQSDAVRMLAIDIAGACRVQSLQEDLVAFALDKEQPIRIRIRATLSFFREESADEAMIKLRPLALKASDDDPDDELKGLALVTLWPKYVSAQELFPALHPPKNPDLIGAYRGFLSRELADHLEPTDLSFALNWVEASIRDGWHRSVEEAVNQILFMAWKHLDVPSILETFARIALLRLMSFDKIISGEEEKQFLAELHANEDQRHRIAMNAVQQIKDPKAEAFWLVHGPSPIVLPTDVPWMIERLGIEADARVKDIWAYLIMSALDRSNNEHVEAAYFACETSPELDAWLSGWFKPVRLDSPEAQMARERHAQARQIEERRSDQLQIVQNTYDEQIQQIDELLSECETDNLDAWWHLNLILLRNRDEGFIREHSSNFQEFDPWQGADLLTRARIIEAGKQFILNRSSEPAEWLGRNTVYRPAYAGYRAFRILLDEDPEFLEIMPQQAWQNWAPIILAFPTNKLEEAEAQERLIEKAYPHAGQEILDTLTRLVEKENEESQHLFILRKIRHISAAELNAELLGFLRDKELSPDATGELLSFLLDRNTSKAREITRAELSSGISEDNLQRSKKLMIAQALFCHAQDAGWGIIWPIVMKNEAFGRDLFLIVAGRSDYSCRAAANRLQSEEIAELFIWLMKQFPRGEDPNEQRFHAISPREMLGTWRDSLLHTLASKGTYNACRQIQNIMDDFRDLDLNWLMQSALTQARRSAWVPPAPSELLELVSSSTYRLVRKGEELLDVLVESLGRLEQELQGETPAAPDLWNEVAKNTYRPKDELAFSDYVKRFLERDLKQRGIVVNREVEIRRGEGESHGERTDIHVDAISKHPGDDAYDRIKVIIEAKGLWNKDLQHAMKTQLVERYLYESDCQHGIYLVGWFNCPQWDNDDWRKRRAPQWELDDGRDHFINQAKELNIGSFTVRAFVMNVGLR